MNSIVSVNPERALQDIKKATRVLDRLKSIKSDSEFVLYILELIDGDQSFPRYANLRCGLWYTQLKHTDTCYFKSTDGHVGQWNFVLSRTNLHAARDMLKHGAGFVVDATRSGKRFPDALARTVPIWCCVLNRAMKRVLWTDDAPAGDWEGLHMHAEDSENYLVEEQFIPGFVDLLIQHKKKVFSLLLAPKNEPQLTNDTILWGAMGSAPNLLGFEFIPIICISASGAIDGTERVRSYVQGAGDDEESWALGLTPEVFWTHVDEIIGAGGEADVHRCIERLAASAEFTTFTRYSVLGTTGIVLGGRSSREGINFDEFDCILNVSELPDKGVPDALDYLHIPVPDGKKGKSELYTALPRAIEFILAAMKSNKRLLVHCDQGKNRSVAMTIAALMYVDVQDLDAEIVLQDKPLLRATAAETKAEIQARLYWIQRYRPLALPTRTTMKVLHKFFQS